MRMIALVDAGDGSSFVRDGDRMARIDAAAWTDARPLAPLFQAASSPAPAATVEPPSPPPRDTNKVAASLRRVAGLPKGKSRVRSDAQLVARARRLIEVQDYSIKRAAAAVGLNYQTLYGIAKREGWEVQKRTATAAREKSMPAEKPYTAVRCPNCKRLTETQPCRYCFERVPALGGP